MGLKGRPSLLVISILSIAVILIAIWFHFPHDTKKVDIYGGIPNTTSTGYYIDGNIKVTLWHDGKIVQIPNNPQYTQNTPQIGWPNGTNWYEFDNLTDDDYYIIAEKDGYMEWDWYDHTNPMPLTHPLFIGPNATGLYVDQYIGRQIQIYDNISKTETDEALSIASNNSSVIQTVNGSNYDITDVCRQNDTLGYKTVYTVSYLEQPGASHYWSPKFGSLYVTVNLEDEKIIAIRQQ